MPQTCLLRAYDKVTVATGNTLWHMSMFVADMLSTLQVVPVLAADRPGTLSWVQLSHRSVGYAFSPSEMIGGDYLSCECPLVADTDITASILAHDCSIASPNSICFKAMDGEESCYDHEVEGQSSPNNNSKLMDTIREYLCIYNARHKYKDHRSMARNC